MKRSVFLGVCYGPTVRERSQSAPPTFAVPFHWCVQHLSQNYQISRGNTYGKRLESLFQAVCVSEVKSRIARTTERQRSMRFPIDLSRNELAAFLALPEVEIWRRSWSAGKFVPGSLCFRNNVCCVWSARSVVLVCRISNVKCRISS